MNGAESLLRSLVASGVDVCFANPGTSEMHFVAALDCVPGMRAVLVLQENVATGAADGYARMTGRPACTLLHLGPGLANGLANLHNARRAASPIVNIVGDHASFHLAYDAPLTSDVKGFARPVSAWLQSSSSARDVGADAARAVRAALEPPGEIATLILPADTAWQEAEGVAPRLAPSAPAAVAEATIAEIAKRLGTGRKAAILMRGQALLDRGLTAAGRIAAKTGARLMCDTSAPRIQRGAGRPNVERLPYLSEHAVQFLAGTELLILVGAKPPVSFFGYPDKASWLTPDGCQIATLAMPHEDGVAALQALTDACGATNVPPRLTDLAPPDYPLHGALTPDLVMRVVARHLPANAIVADEAVSAGLPYYDLTAAAAPHDYLNITGGAIGCMMAVSTGAAIACPDRKVVTLQGDGSAMYILPALWTQAREALDVTTVIYANRGYKILNSELLRVGAANGGRNAASLLDLTNPTIDWVLLASGLGVDAVKAETPTEFETAFVRAMQTRGPHLIEAVV
ncbi:MAG: acetolactate synthase large subunit [Ancalomicrobiaceae bacterium]|nr:acetolactate synthase large subunit [Ancalomicrobiaceae bacterium]